MDLREALSQITQIREQMARSEVFRGYRAAPAAVSGAVALGAAAIQPWWVNDPVHELREYLLLWMAAAAISVAVFAVEMTVRYRRRASALQREMMLAAIEQFAPCLVAGATLTAVMAKFSPEVAWMLPGLWQVLFALGIFASRRMLPWAISAPGMFYLLAGLVVLALGQGERALAPWMMGVPFGAGQMLVAVVLYWNLERGDSRQM